MADAPPQLPALSPKQERFCQLVLITENGAEAARQAKYAPRRAKQRAAELLRLPQVQARIAQLRAERTKRLEIKADDVLRELWAIAKADPRELIEYRVGACRYCHGVGHKYQRTPAERERDQKAQGSAFDELGGAGYNRNQPPHPECPECHGLGEGFTVVKDQRIASPAAARLLAGVKETKEGIEVKMHDPQAALVSVGKHLGMFTERVDHTTDGKPLPPPAIMVTLVKPQP